MRGDFSRDTFDPHHPPSRVLMQQGRVLLDSDWNEQVAVQTHYLRELARDIIGWHGTWDENSFKVGVDNGKLTVTEGKYYVDGILCSRNGEDQCRCLGPKGSKTLVYLDVWEENSPGVDYRLREPALGEIDTCKRLFVRCEIGTTSLAEAECENEPWCEEQTLRKCLTGYGQPGKLAARIKAHNSGDPPDHDPCEVPYPDEYLGVENHLYRVEIHSSGVTCPNDDPFCVDDADRLSKVATFKWSRDNGTALVPVKPFTTNKCSELCCETRCKTRTLHLFPSRQGDGNQPKAKQWIEIVPNSEAKPLVQIEAFDPETWTVTLAREVELRVNCINFLRLWDHYAETLPAEARPEVPHPNSPPADSTAECCGDDQPQAAQSSNEKREQKQQLQSTLRDRALQGQLTISDNGAAYVVAGLDGDSEIWLGIEDGLEIHFEPGRFYERGNAWLIPVRTDGADVLEPFACCKAQSPHEATRHHYAPLAILGVDKEGHLSVKQSLRVIRKRNTVDPCKEPDPRKAKVRAPAPTCESYLSPEGERFLREQLAPEVQLARRLPAKFLRCRVTSLPLRKWVDTAFVSELTRRPVEEISRSIRAKVDVQVRDDKLFEAELRTLQVAARECQRALLERPLTAQQQRETPEELIV